MEKHEAKRLIKLRMCGKQFKQFENSSRINRFFMRTYTNTRPKNEEKQD